MQSDQPSHESSPSLIEGTIQVHVRGFAFVSPSDHSADIFIPKIHKGGAVSGDQVMVQLLPFQKKGNEGKVVEIISRAKSDWVGVVYARNEAGDALIYLPSMGENKAARIDKNLASRLDIGDRLLLRVTDWKEENEPAECTILESMGTIDQAEGDIPSAILDFGLAKDFPKSVLKEAAKHGKQVKKKELQGRVDLSALEAVTIDPDTAKDFDDALSLTCDQRGHYHLGVHIADVSHYVTPGSALDDEAKQRGNSTYFPQCCLPMLPESLSNNLCSLREGVNRLTVSVLAELNADGHLLSARVVKGWIKSRKRLTYGEAAMILNGTLSSPHKALLHRLAALCKVLKKQRRARGSIEMSLPEIVLMCDESGMPCNYQVHPYDITHQLVEECMLKANEIVARFLVEERGNAIFRIHDKPDRESLESFYSLVRRLGYRLPKEPSSEQIQKVLDQAIQKEGGDQLVIAFIRTMKMAIYSHKNEGHYGLALDNYLHFTSPIRRYTDLVVHRLLDAPNDEKELMEVARECSEKERLSFKAEMQVMKLKKLRLLDKYHREESDRWYQGLITQVRPFGFAFEVSPLGWEGFIHVADLPDHYHYVAKKEQLVDTKRKTLFSVGNKIDLRLASVDLIQCQTRWTLGGGRDR
ncbi:MAG: ribonuclease R family protein [Chlamydiota bacterium]|nr:ribonuclease R family protein [Chlamydiota bacterium]